MSDETKVNLEEGYQQLAALIHSLCEHTPCGAGLESPATLQPEVAAGPASEMSWPAEVPLAIVQTNRGRVGVAVDRFIGQVEVIVKPMGREFADIAAFQGTTIMGDGRVVLVINPAGFI